MDGNTQSDLAQLLSSATRFTIQQWQANNPNSADGIIFVILVIILVTALHSDNSNNSIENSDNSIKITN